MSPLINATDLPRRCAILRGGETFRDTGGSDERPFSAIAAHEPCDLQVYRRGGGFQREEFGQQQNLKTTIYLRARAGAQIGDVVIVDDDPDGPYRVEAVSRPTDNWGTDHLEADCVAIYTWPGLFLFLDPALMPWTGLALSGL